MIEKLGITQGPWEAIQSPCGNYIKGVFSGHDSAYGGWYEEPDVEDLILIATAPEMLEALIKISIGDWIPNAYGNKYIKNIIKKATGKTWEEIKELIK